MRFSSHGKSVTRSMLADKRGAVALVFGLMFTVIMVAIAGCLDMVRAYNMSTQLQVALDAAALAGAKALQEDNATDASVQAASVAMFKTYLPNLKIPGVATANFKAVADWDNDTVTTSINADVSSYIGRLLKGSRNKLIVNPSSTVSYKADKVEVALVVDVTGSMNQIPAGDTKTKIQSLKDAANIVIDTLMANSPTEDAVRISVVPFSASVNAGALANATSASPAVTTCSMTWFFGYKCTTTAGADVDTCVIERDHSYEDSDPSVNKIPAVPYTPYGNYVCPPATVIPLQGRSNVSTLKATVNAYAAAGATAGHIGAAWG